MSFPIDDLQRTESQVDSIKLDSTVFCVITRWTPYVFYLQMDVNNKKGGPPSWMDILVAIWAAPLGVVVRVTPYGSSTTHPIRIQINDRGVCILYCTTIPILKSYTNRGVIYRHVHSSDCWIEKLKPYGSCLFSFYVCPWPNFLALGWHDSNWQGWKQKLRLETSINQNRLDKYQ
jgi:hypothetical protein